MAHTVKIDLRIQVDGGLERRFVRTVSVDELGAPFAEIEKANDGGTYSAPNAVQDLDSISVLFLKTDQQVTARLDGQSDAGIVLNAGGFLLVCDGTIDASASTNLTSSNNSGSTANYVLLAAGS